MNAFANAIRHEENFTTTQNGLPANKSTQDNLLDLFFRAPSLRKAPPKGSREKNRRFFENSREFSIARDLFFAAFEEDPALAFATLFYIRDVRGGAGERQIFRSLFKEALSNTKTSQVALATVHLIPAYGRWDDVWACIDPFNKKYERLLRSMLISGLKDNNHIGLVAKWLPRPKGKDLALARRLAEICGFEDIQDYRQFIAEKTVVVETLMSNKDWYKVDFEKVPSVAMARYTKAFNKNAEDYFTKYKEGLRKGTTKINTAVLFPYEVIKNLRKSGDDDLASSQWKALPNNLREGVNILPIVDVSASMTWTEIAPGVQPLDVAASLGIYCSEKQTGAFKDLFMTFSSSPEFVNLGRTGDSLNGKLRKMFGSNVGGNTDILAALDLILQTAIKNRVPQKDMPDVLLILSDMQFDAASRDTSYGRKDRFIDIAKARFAEHGYITPNVFFWNLNGSYDNVPVTVNDKGVACISGFSTNILKQVCSGDISPMYIFAEAIINSGRYGEVIKAVKEKL